MIRRDPNLFCGQRGRASHGFTLVELMVALSGGLFVSLAVFALAKNGGRFYQRESRLANATLGALVGFQRLRSDLARAGFLSTPNIRRDPFVCSKPAAGWPAGMTNLASLRIVQGGSPANTALTANSRAPDSIVLGGAYASSDEFPIRTVLQTNNAYNVYLQANTGPMARIGYQAASSNAALQQTRLEAVFGPLRMLRIVDNSGQEHFGQITSVTGGANPVITLDPNPALQFRSGSAAECGLTGLGTGSTANVVNLIQYDVRSLAADPNYAAYSALYASNLAAPYDDQRTELARIELDANGNPIQGTGELVAEYAVDLQFSYSVANSVVAGNPSLTYVDPTNATFADYAGDTLTSPLNAGPQLIRSLRVRFSVRSREADREGDVPGSGAANTGLYRFRVSPDGVTPPAYARTRTFQSDIALYNQMAVNWQ